MVGICKTIAESTRFQNFITFVILLAAVVVGIETYPAMVERYGPFLHTLNRVVLWIFVAEIAVKMIAEGKRPWRYFTDPWNVFDFVIVAGAFLPFAAQYATVLRLLRLLRVLRLLRAVPKLQMLVGALLKSIPSMGYVSMLLGLLFYVYAVAGVFLFGENDPVHFGNLQIALVSLFRIVTLEDWTDIMYTQMWGCNEYGYEGMQALCTAPTASPVLGAAFFISFVLVGTMIILNLFIGVILSGMDEAQSEADEAMKEHNARISGKNGGEGPAEPSLREQLRALSERLGEMQQQVASLEKTAGREAARHPEQSAPATTPAPAE